MLCFDLRIVKLPVRVFTSESIEGVRPVSDSFRSVRYGIYE